MQLCENLFYVGDLQSFQLLVKLLRGDPEFRLAFDFDARSLEMESMLMSGVVGIGSRLVQGPKSIIVPSPITRTGRVTLRMDSGALFQALVGLNQAPYAYMTIGLSPEEDAIWIRTYTKDQVKMGEALVRSLNLEDHDEDFLVVNEDKREALPYELSIEQVGATWKTYMQASTIDTIIRYTRQTRTMTWESKHAMTTLSLYLPVNTPCLTDVCVCLLPSVLSILRGVLQVTTRHVTTLSIGLDLPVRLFAPLDTGGSFIRVYAGTKED